jgi:hypothetical protein
MSVMNLLRPIELNEIAQEHFVVVHPLDDVPEQKVNITALGPMPMTASVKVSLMLLRGYLVLMMLLVLYHVVDLAGGFGMHSH